MEPQGLLEAEGEAAMRGLLAAEGQAALQGLLVPSPQSEAVAHELEELTLQPSQNLPPLNERKNGERPPREAAPALGEPEHNVLLVHAG